MIELLIIDPMRGKIDSDLPAGITENLSSVSLGISGSVSAIWAVEGFWRWGLSDETKVASLKFPRPKMPLSLGFSVIVVFISKNFGQQKADLILVKMFVI